MSDPGAWSRWGPPPERPPEPPRRALTPAGVMQLVGTGARIYRRHWRPLVAATALIAGIAVIVSEVAAAASSELMQTMMTTDPTTGRFTLTASDAELQRLAVSFLVSTGINMLSGAFLVIASLVGATYVDAIYRGATPVLRDAIRHAVRRSPIALAAWLVNTLVVIALVVATAGLAVLMAIMLPADPGGGIGAFLALIVAVGGGVAIAVVSVRWSVAFAVVAVEPVRPLGALRRSWHLTGQNAWRSFGLQLLVVFVVGVLVALITTIVQAFVIGSLGTSATLQFGSTIALGVILTLLTAPILPVMLAVLYFDLRVRRDRSEPSLAPTP